MAAPTLSLDVEMTDEEGTYFEPIEIPAHFEVCPICRGMGSIVNPAIDGNGISQDQFDDDPDFFDEYRSGMYDITCTECDGDRVVTVPDLERLTPLQRRAWEEREQYLEELRAEQRRRERGIEW